MRFMALYRPVEEASGPPSAQQMADMGRLIGEWTEAGVLASTEGLLPSALGARVSMDGEIYSVTDGPFTGGDRVVGGYAILNVGSKAHAIELTKAFLRVVGGGESELRQMYEASPASP